MNKSLFLYSGNLTNQRCRIAKLSRAKEKGIKVSYCFKQMINQKDSNKESVSDALKLNMARKEPVISSL